MSLTDSTIRVPPLALLVDSDADTREMYGEWLRFSGFRIVEARTAWEALEMVREQGLVNTASHPARHARRRWTGSL